MLHAILAEVLTLPVGFARLTVATTVLSPTLPQSGHALPRNEQHTELNAPVLHIHRYIHPGYQHLAAECIGLMSINTVICEYSPSRVNHTMIAAGLYCLCRC